MIARYPVPPVNAEGFLAVTGGHEVYWEESGTRDGVPVVFLHGGPGAAPGSFARCFFNPSKFRIVVFHQRGCGKSRPLYVPFALWPC